MRIPRSCFVKRRELSTVRAKTESLDADMASFESNNRCSDYGRLHCRCIPSLPTNPQDSPKASAIMYLFKSWEGRRRKTEESEQA